MAPGGRTTGEMPFFSLLPALALPRVFPLAEPSRKWGDSERPGGTQPAGPCDQSSPAWRPHLVPLVDNLGQGTLVIAKKGNNTAVTVPLGSRCPAHMPISQLRKPRPGVMSGEGYHSLRATEMELNRGGIQSFRTPGRQ